MFKAGKLIIIIPLVFFAQVLYAQWISNYFGSGYSQHLLSNAHGTAVTVDNSGNCYVTGYIDDMNGAGNDVLVIKYNASTGDTLWVRTFNGSDNNNDAGYGVAVDVFQNVYVVGTAKNLGKGYDGILLKYNSSGTLLWSKPFNGDLGSGEDGGLAIAVDNLGNIYITGYETCQDLRTDIYTAKYNAWGYRYWQRREDGTDGLNARGVKVCISNSGEDVYVAGYINYSTGSSNICLISYDAFDGDKKFLRTYNGPGNSEDKAFGIAVDELDNIYISGFVTVDSIGLNTDCVVLKYNTDGNLMWDRTFGGPANEIDKAFGIVVDEDRIFVTGSARQVSGNDDYITLSYSSQGNLLWSKFYDGTGHGSDEAKAIAVIDVNSFKEVIVTGKSWGTDNNDDYATVVYSTSDGSVQNESRYSLSAVSEDVPADIAVDAQNNAYITGFSQLLGNGPTGSCAITTIMNKHGERNKKSLVNQIPEKYKLYQNYPNPFNPSTTLKFDIPSKTAVKLVIYDMLGKIVEVLVDKELEAGIYNINFTNNAISSGIYFYKLTAGDFSEIRKMSLIK